MADTAEGRTCGIQWPADRGEWFAGLTFARGATPDELAARLGAVPGVRPGPLGAPAAWSMATETADGEGVARVGSWGGWSCEPVCCFGPGEECRRGGHRPDFLLPELVAAGVLGPDGANAGPDDEPDEDRERRTLAVLETPLRTGPAAALIADAPLPAYVTCTRQGVSSKQRRPDRRRLDRPAMLCHALVCRSSRSRRPGSGDLMLGFTRVRWFWGRRATLMGLPGLVPEQGDHSWEPTASRRTAHPP